MRLARYNLDNRAKDGKEIVDTGPDLKVDADVRCHRDAEPSIWAARTSDGKPRLETKIAHDDGDN